MKQREHLPVSEEWGPDRVEFRFFMHPARAQVWVLVFLAIFCAPAVFIGLALSASGSAPTVTAVLAGGSLALLPLCFVPFFAWPRLDRATPVVVSRDRLCIGARAVLRSEVEAVEVRLDRLIVRRKDGSTLRSPPLVGLSQDRFQEALDRFRPDDRELEDGHAAAAEAERRLESLRERAR